jgi:hypothetical protein
VEIREEPPYEINGKVTPTTGTMLIAEPILKKH